MCFKIASLKIFARKTEWNQYGQEKESTIHMSRLFTEIIVKKDYAPLINAPPNQ